MRIGAMQLSVRRRLAASAFGLLWLVWTMPVAAQGIPLGWQALGGPGGRISHLAASADGRELYAVSVTAVNRRDDQTQWRDTGGFFRSDALYRSTDAGVTWRPLTNDLPPGAITALYVDPVTHDLWVGLQGGDLLNRRNGLWRSRDRGAEWGQVSLGRDDLNILRIVRSADNRSLYLGAIEAIPSPASYILRSSDDGQTWNAFHALTYEQRPGSLLDDLIPHPTLTAALLIATEGGEFYLSLDAGETWNLSNPADASAQPRWLGPARLAISSPDRSQTWLLVRQRSGMTPAPWLIERSTDRGTTWTPQEAAGLEVGSTARAVAALPGGVFLLSTGTGAYRSVNEGVTWQRLEGPLSAGGVSEFLVVPGPGAASTVIAATGDGIFASRDGGALWAPLGAGLPFNSRIAALLTDRRQPERFYIIPDNQPLWGLAAPPLVLRSTDAGRTWLPVARSLPDVYLTAWALAPDDPDTLYLAAFEHFLRSTDGGLSWSTTHLPFGMHRTITVDPTDPATLYLGGWPPLRSSDRGATWSEMPVILPGQARQASNLTAVAVDLADNRHLVAAFDGDGIGESTDRGATWQAAGLAGQRVRWLVVAADREAAGGRVYAGVPEAGIYRRDGGVWVMASAGLPISSTILALVADPRTPGTLWASRDGGGLYRSTDRGDTWSNVGADLGDNLVQALAVDYSLANGVLLGTTTAGIWALRPNAPALPTRAAVATPEPVSGESGLRTGVDARIEIVWPHGGADVTQAAQANIGLRLFQPRSLLPTNCGWSPKVTVWQATDTAPAGPLGDAQQRVVDGRPFPYWELNDVDVSRATDPEHKLYFMVRVGGLETATSIWAHGADPRTYFPSQDVPSGTATGPIEAVDARIQIVWPHDAAGAGTSVAEGHLANVAVAFFKHGTRLSVPIGWQPAGITLYGAWNGEVSRPLTRDASVQTRRAGAITYPVWEFNNIPVARAANPQNKLYLWVSVDEVATYPTIWSHGADARTFYPLQDEPIQGCVP